MSNCPPRVLRFSVAVVTEWLQNKTSGGNEEKPHKSCRCKKRKFTGTLDRREGVERIISSAKMEVLVNK